MELSKVMKLKKKFVGSSIKQKIYFARFHFYNTHILIGHQRLGPSRERRSGGSYFKIPSHDIL